MRLLSQTAEPAQRMPQTLAQTSVWETAPQGTLERLPEPWRQGMIRG
ncbi:hypothetical protein [Escherichia coli]